MVAEFFTHSSTFRKFSQESFKDKVASGKSNTELGTQWELKR